MSLIKEKCYPIVTPSVRGVAQSGSAPHWGCGGRRFKSCRPDHFFPLPKPFKTVRRQVPRGLGRCICNGYILGVVDFCDSTEQAEVETLVRQVILRD